MMQVYKELKSGATLQAFEMFSQLALDKVLKHTDLPKPFQENSPFYVVCEFENPHESSLENVMATFEKLVEKGLVSDGLISQSEQQAKTFWRYREDISECLSHYSPYKNDIAVAISKVPDFMNDLDQVLLQQIS